MSFVRFWVKPSSPAPNNLSGTRAIEFRGLLCCSLAPLLPGSALLGPVQAKYHLGLSNPRLPLARFYWCGPTAV